MSREHTERPAHRPAPRWMQAPVTVLGLAVLAAAILTAAALIALSN
jgi:hypothetical protein